MAKIVIEFDTNEKTMSATLDGAAVANVMGAYLGKSYCCDDEDEFRCELIMSEKNEDQDYVTQTRIVASETKAAAALTGPEVHPTVPGFVIAERSGGVNDEVLAYFGRGRRKGG